MGLVNPNVVSVDSSISLKYPLNIPVERSWSDRDIDRLGRHVTRLKFPNVALDSYLESRNVIDCVNSLLESAQKVRDIISVRPMVFLI